MPKANIILNPNVTLGEIALDVSTIYPNGDPHFPFLTIPTEITVHACLDNQKKPPAAVPISLLRIAGEFCSPAQRVIVRFQEEIGLTAGNPHAANKFHCRFEIPLDLRILTQMEEARTGDLQCALILRPLLAIHHNNNVTAQVFSLGRVDHLAFNIPRSQWVDLLPRLGYGGLELLEVRYGHGVVAFHFPKSVEEIQHAKRYLLERDWDKAVTHCRRAVEVIMDSKPSSVPQQAKFREKVDAFIGDHLPNIDDRQAKLLSEQMRMIWEVGSQLAHANSSPPAKRADAEFVVRATMALVEYFSKLLR
ncbi:MAG: hypothetical protein JWQ87_5229 [Candidatus Sulfotelmatobacter sp.]|nr:hypothetical protein [Candidatus Sulfotelmatobacter sp.]